MSHTRRMFDSTQKAVVVRRHLKDGVPVSEHCKELDVQPSQVHQWINAVLSQADKAFEEAGKSSKRSVLSLEKRQTRKIENLERQLVSRNEVIAELMEENVKAKKEWGPLKGRWVPHDTRDQIVDYINYWRDRAPMLQSNASAG